MVHRYPSLLLPRIPAVFVEQTSNVAPRFASIGSALTICALILTPTDSSLAQGSTPAQRPAPPAPDIYLAPLLAAGTEVTVGAPLNFTARVGYDNQPAFLSDGSAVLFTSVREDAQADIYRYDIASRQTTRVTTTAPESEYSATPLQDGRAISVIRVERDSTQRLWRFPLDGGEPSVILDRIRPVGYHAWADDSTVALFVLGSPNSLQLANTRRPVADTIATGIGRSLHRIPGARTISFVRKVSQTEWWLESLDVATRRAERLMRMPEGVEDYAWLPDRSVICGRGSTLLRWSGKAGDDWRVIADLAGAGVKGITRLAISPRGDRIAFVAEGR